VTLYPGISLPKLCIKIKGLGAIQQLYAECTDPRSHPKKCSFAVMNSAHYLRRIRGYSRDLNFARIGHSVANRSKIMALTKFGYSHEILVSYLETFLLDNL